MSTKYPMKIYISCAGNSCRGYLIHGSNTYINIFCAIYIEQNNEILHMIRLYRSSKRLHASEREIINTAVAEETRRGCLYTEGS